MDQKKEEDLIRQSAYDTKAFGELFVEYYDCILRYCIYHTGDVEVGRDLTAETFFKALKNIESLKRKNGKIHFSAWLYKIARNEIIDYCRKKKRSSFLEEHLKKNDIISFTLRKDLKEEIENLQKKLDDNISYQEVHSLLDKNPIIYKDVIILRFVEDKKISEISEILGKKEGTIKSIISRGMLLLRNLFSEKQYYSL